MLCTFASGARGTFEVSRTLVGPESENAFDVYGTRGAVGWNFERLNELRVYRATADRGSGYTTVLGGDRFGHHGIFVPGSGNTIGFEDLVTIEDYEFCARGGRGAAVRAQLRGCARRGARAGRAVALGGERGLGGGGAVRDRHHRGRAAADRRHRRRADRPDARGADRPPGAGGGARRGVRPLRVAGPRRRPPSSAFPPPRAWRRSFDSDLDAVAICSSSDSHAGAPDRGGGRGQGGVLREARVARPRRARSALDAVRAPGFRSRSASTGALTRPRRGPRGRLAGAWATRTWSESRVAIPRRPRSTTSRARGGIFLDMTIHDFDMARFLTGSEVVEVFARGAVGSSPPLRRPGYRHRAGHARARGRLPDRDRQLPPGRVWIRPARRGVRVARHGRLGEPARPHRVVRTAPG